EDFYRLYYPFNYTAKQPTRLCNSNIPVNIREEENISFLTVNFKRQIFRLAKKEIVLFKDTRIAAAPLSDERFKHISFALRQAYARSIRLPVLKSGRGFVELKHVQNYGIIIERRH